MGRSTLFDLGLSGPTTRYCPWKCPCQHNQLGFCCLCPDPGLEIRDYSGHLPFAPQFRAVDGAVDRVGSSTCSALTVWLGRAELEIAQRSNMLSVPQHAPDLSQKRSAVCEGSPEGLKIEWDWNRLLFNSQPVKA